jgi:hypothetical protein
MLESIRVIKQENKEEVKELICGYCKEVIDYPQLYVLERCDDTFHYECIRKHIQNSVLL